MGLIYLGAAILLAVIVLLPDAYLTQLSKHQCGYWTVFGFCVLSVICSIVETTVLAYWILSGAVERSVAMIIFNVGIVAQLASYLLGSLYLHKFKQSINEGTLIK